MESLQLKKAIFNSTEIVLIRKKGNITINVDDIKRIDYTKPTLLNYFFVSGLFPGGTYPGRLEIYLNKKINKSKSYLVKIKFDEVRKLPDFYIRKIDPTNKWGFYQ